MPPNLMVFNIIFTVLIIFYYIGHSVDKNRSILDKTAIGMIVSGAIAIIIIIFYLIIILFKDYIIPNL